MRKTKKFLALLTALSISTSACAGLASTAFADESTKTWAVPKYSAGNAVHSNSAITATDATVKVGGTEYEIKVLGSISGGIEGASSAEYNSQSGGTATFTVTAETAGEYDVTVTGRGASARRVDLAVGDTVYSFATDTESEYASQWTVISDAGESRQVFTYTFEGVVLAEGENSIAVGTKVDKSWAPDIVGIDVTTPAPIADGITYKNGKVTVKAADVQTARLIYAQYYSNGALELVKTYPLTFDESGIATQALTDVRKGSKLMVWKALEKMTPVCDDTCTITVGNDANEAPTPIPQATATPGADSSPAPTPTAIPTPNPYHLSPVAATYVDQSNPGTAYADAVTLKTGYNKISNGTVGFANTGWGVNYATIIKFDVSGALKEGESVTKAVLTYKGTADGARGRNHIIGSTTLKNWDADATYTSLGASIPFAQIGEAHAIGKGTTVTITQDITDYAKLQDDNIYALCVIDTAAGGSDIDKKSIALDIEVMDPNNQVKLSYIVEGVQTDEIVKKGEKPVNIPNPVKKGYKFIGWKSENSETLLTTAQVADTVFETNTVLTAAFEVDSSYVQSIASVEFVDTTGAVIEPKNVKAYKYPTEAEAVEYMPYEIKVTSDIGNDITADCEITWNAVGGGGIDANYFAFVDKNQEDENAVAVSNKRYARIRQGGESWFGYIKVDVVYDPANSDDDTKNTTGSAQIPCAALANGAIANQILPAEGYPVSMDYYVDDIVDYKATSDDYSYGYDPVLNNWCIVGSLPTRDLLLVKDGDKKALKFTKSGGDRGGSSSSCVGAYSFPTQTAQYVFETIVKFEGDARIGVHNKTTNQSNLVTEWAVSYDGSDALTAGEEKITGIKVNTWYKLIVTSDPVNKLYSVYAYNEDGTPAGSITGVEGGEAGKMLCVDGSLPAYFNSIRAYVPELDTISITADNDVIGVPEAGAAANEVALRAICKTADGFDLTGAVEWNLAEEYDGIELVKGTQTATLKVTDGASGTIKVTASMSGKTAEKEITVTSSKDRVAFTTKASSITIPFDGNPAATAEYLADTITPESPNGTGDKNIEYTFLDKTGAVALDTLPAGITSSVDPETNKLTLTVEAGAIPAVFYVKATQKAGDGLSAKTQVNVHGLSYSFGTDEVEGDTQVTSASLYTDTLGYGFEATTGLTDAADKVTGTAAYKFKANVPNGNYKVTVNTTSASMQSEIIDDAGAGANVAGITKSGSTFNVAVCDGVLDLTFAANSSISSLAIAQIAVQESREKPKVYAIGDSTTQNSDFNALSWGSYLALHAEKVPEAFSSFSNNGKSGANSISFYDRGLMEAVLLDIHEGDYVTVNMGVNWERDGKNDTVAYEKVVDNYFVKAIIDRGGIPVITTSTPLGYNTDASKSWTEKDGKITCNRTDAARNPILRKIAVKYNLNIIELSYYGESYLNSLTMDDVTAYNAANGTSFASTIELARSWWSDHNHYREPLAVVFSEYMMDCLTKIAGGDTSFNQANDPHINEQ